MIGAIHSCYLHTTDQRIDFDTGSVAFPIGSVVTGVSSNATGTVKSITVTEGAWGDGDAEGYMVLSNVTDSFQDDESLSGNPSGTAVSAGISADYIDDYGRKTQTVSSTATPCRFVNLKAPVGNTEYGWSGKFPAVLFDPGISLQVDQRLTSTETGFSGTFEIQWPPVYYPDAQGGIHHVTCALKGVT